ncbi:MAG: hypothetical protein J0H98_02770 [Solirubrobacterales bacterium]|nr:hypothetical protein [Solirubrobacterales bacterium]
MTRIGRFHPHAELLATILLAVAAVATAWSSYQSARWSGVQANQYSAGNAARVESTQLSTEAGQKTEVDVLTFTQWVDAYSTGDRRLADFYFQRFRPEFKPAVTAWVATRPLKNPNAPPTPFAMPRYEVAENAEAASKTKDAEEATAAAQEANQRSDNYVLAVVLFAASLFFAGISTKLSVPRQKMTVLGLGYFVFLGTAIWVATFPVTVSV